MGPKRYISFRCCYNTWWFSYGDYLRAGAIASVTPVIDGIKELVKDEKPVLGICNGAQILAEASLVPGVLQSIKMLNLFADGQNLRLRQQELLSHTFILKMK